jgi:hypothetical protein
MSVCCYIKFVSWSWVITPVLKMATGRNFSISGINSGHHNLPTYEMSLKSDNVPCKKFESTVVQLKRSYEDTGSVVCLTTKGRQLERNFEELNCCNCWYNYECIFVIAPWGTLIGIQYIVLYCIVVLQNAENIMSKSKIF